MIYDFIIYPANIFGIAASIKLSYAGKNILLLNKYGFIGGDISSALNLYQKLPETDNSFTTDIIIKLAKEDGFLWSNNKAVIINPEVYKFICQDVLENSKTNLLFHIRPLGVFKTGNEFEIQLLGKEGILKFKATGLIDLSENQELTDLVEISKRNFIQQRINFITNKIIDLHSFENYNDVSTNILSDGRLFASVKIESAIELDEIKAQQYFNKLAIELNKRQRRIQIVPVESFAEYSFSFVSEMENLISFGNLGLEEIKSNERFLQSQKIERHFG
jgi:hypothetical protein